MFNLVKVGWRLVESKPVFVLEINKKSAQIYPFVSGGGGPCRVGMPMASCKPIG
jgi:hypothetical protein